MDPTLQIDNLPTLSDNVTSTAHHFHNEPTTEVESPLGGEVAEAMSLVVGGSEMKETVAASSMQLDEFAVHIGKSNNAFAAAVVAVDTDGAAHGGEEPDASLGGSLTLKDLFGAHFEINMDDTKPVADPMLVDTHHILEMNFGPFVSEMDIDFANYRTALETEMQANKGERHLVEVERLFGIAGLESLLSDKVEAFQTLRSSAPSRPVLADGVEKVWLVEMPKIAPNRQTMHADPQPYFPSTCQYLKSDARMLFTPQNVLRWAHHKGNNIFMSNSRVVRWSDGSVTLHVGSDVFNLQESKGNAVTSIIGSATTIRKDTVELPAVAATIKPGSHFVTESTGATSVERAVIAESVQHRNVATKLKLPYVTAPMPQINWAKPRRDSTNTYEEYVANEYDKRQKVMEKRRREGRPMTLAEQMAMEEELLQHLKTTSVDVLKEQQEDAKRENALRTLQRKQEKLNGRPRFDPLLYMDTQNSAMDAYRAAASEEEEGSSEEGFEDGEDIQSMLQKMYRKRERGEDGDEGNAGAADARKLARYEEEKVRKFAPLVEVLEKLASLVSMNTEAYASLHGTLDYIRSGSFSADVLKSELLTMLEEVERDAPTVDSSAARSLYNAIYSA